MTSSADTAAKFGADPARWRSVEASDPQALEKARVETINIVQWLARIANSYVTARAPDDRVLLAFRAADAAFVTKTFDDGLSLEMRLPSLEMQFLENGRAAPHILDPEEHSPAEVEAWLLVELLHRGVDRSKFTKQLPYSIPNLMTGDAEDYSPQSCRKGLTELMAWFQNAAAILEAAARGLQDRQGRHSLLAADTRALMHRGAPDQSGPASGFRPATDDPVSHTSTGIRLRAGQFERQQQTPDPDGVPAARGKRSSERGDNVLASCGHVTPVSGELAHVCGFTFPGRAIVDGGMIAFEPFAQFA